MFNNINFLFVTGIFVSRGGKPSRTYTWMQIFNPSTSAKPVKTKLQNLFVALVNMDTFQMTLKFSLLTVE